MFEHYLGDDSKRETPPAEDSGDEDDRRNPGNLYDKVSPVSPAPRFVRGRNAAKQDTLSFSTFFNLLNSHNPFLGDF